MKPSKLLRFAGVFLIVMTVVNAASALAAGNSVPSSRLDEDSFSITANDLKPPQCAGINLTNIVTGSGNINGTGANDLILGSAGVDNIRGQGGDDCIVSGSGNDRLAGFAGADVLLGGGGDDTLLGGQGNDDLYGEAGYDDCNGGNGTDSGNSCEVMTNIP